MPTSPAWRLRDTVASNGLFLATAAFTLWQNARVAALWDISFLLNTSYRFSTGQLPYKTLPFPYAPLTFLLHTAIIRIFGRVYLPHILCAALEAGAATLLTWRILLNLLKQSEAVILAQPESPSSSLSPPTNHAWLLALLLAAPLTLLGIYGVYPHPIYDSDTILAVLLALFLLQRIATASSVRGLLTGAACVVPVLFKQNIGLLFLFVAVAAIATIATNRRHQRQPITSQLWLFAGAAIAFTCALSVVQWTVGLHNYVHWTITFARQRRLPGLPVMLSTYNQTSLLWTLPAAIAALVLLRRSARWSRRAAVFLLAAPFLWTILSLLLTSDPSDRADQLLSLWPHLLILATALAFWNLRPANFACLTFNTLLPVILLVTIQGTFLSQQLWGSTYALWPLLILLIAALLTQIPGLARPLAIVITATFLLCGGLYAVSHERLSYVQLDGTIARATLPELHGLATPGPWIPAFEELVRVTNAEIPANDEVLLVPSEDPFYFATGRVTHFPVLLFDPAIDPYTPQQTRELARASNIRWLIVDTDLQLAAPPHPDLPEIVSTLQQDFVLYRILPNYTIYRRK